MDINASISKYSDVVQGTPLAYLPAEAIPPVCSIQKKGVTMALKIQGCLVEIDGKTYFEIKRVNLE